MIKTADNRKAVKLQSTLCIDVQSSDAQSVTLPAFLRILTLNSSCLTYLFYVLTVFSSLEAQTAPVLSPFKGKLEIKIATSEHQHELLFWLLINRQYDVHLETLYTVALSLEECKHSHWCTSGTWAQKTAFLEPKDKSRSIEACRNYSVVCFPKPQHLSSYRIQQ